MPIRRFLEPGAKFDPDDLTIMSEAFEAALRRLGPAGKAAKTREVLARRIIAVARRGERDREKMCTQALAATREAEAIPA
jgi:hypothetical protein